MSVKPPYYKQETNYSCVAASFRMVLAHLGIFKSEEDLRELTQTTQDVAFLSKVVEAAEEIGLEASKNYFSFDELLTALDRGIFPIVQIKIPIKVSSLIQEYAPHVVVVIEATPNSIGSLDPEQGEVTYDAEEFKAMWMRTRGLTILVSKP